MTQTPPQRLGFKRILAPVDGGPVARHAAKIAVELARTLGAEVATLFVEDPPSTYAGGVGLSEGEIREIAEADDHEVLAELRHEVEMPEGSTHLLCTGRPAEEICRTAKAWGADLIVVGSHGRSGLSKALLGSVAEAVVRQAPCPVLVVRGEKHPN